MPDERAYSYLRLLIEEVAKGAVAPKEKRATIRQRVRELRDQVLSRIDGAQDFGRANGHRWQAQRIKEWAARYGPPEGSSPEFAAGWLAAMEAIGRNPLQAPFAKGEEKSGKPPKFWP